MLLIGLGLMLLRFLGEHTWAYWTAAVIGALGVLAAAVEIVATVRALIAGRQPLVAIWVISLLAWRFGTAAPTARRGMTQALSDHRSLDRLRGGE
ncbi:hypothetical protein SGLAM104S_05596 [Streptomyces glaucescens]